MKDLLKLAREAIKSELEGKNFKISESIKKKYSDKKACFVTLTIDGELRGCIGSLQAKKELWKDVVENSKNAAFSDPRFDKLTHDEFKKIKIEISVLTIPKKLKYKLGDNTDLLTKIKGKGVIIKKGFNQATYLPQVWEDIADTEYFIENLCLKAGLEPVAWLYEQLEIWTYEVEKVSE